MHLLATAVSWAPGIRLCAPKGGGTEILKYFLGVLSYQFKVTYKGPSGRRKKRGEMVSRGAFMCQYPGAHCFIIQPCTMKFLFSQ